MDVLSDGRVDIGIGAGWMETDYRSADAYDRSGVRVDRLAEALAVIKGMMGDGPFSFEGTHYTIRLRRSAEAGTATAPADPHRRRWTQGPVDRRREADIVGINGQMTAGVIGPEAIATMTYEAVAERLALVREVSGPRVEDIELNIRAFIVRSPTTGRGAVSQIGFVQVDDEMIGMHRSPSSAAWTRSPRRWCAGARARVQLRDRRR